MGHRHQGADAEAQLEAVPDVDQHADQRQHDRQDALLAQLGADQRPDVLGPEHRELADHRPLPQRRHGLGAHGGRRRNLLPAVEQAALTALGDDRLRHPLVVLAGGLFVLRPQPVGIELQQQGGQRISALAIEVEAPRPHRVVLPVQGVDDQLPAALLAALDGRRLDDHRVRLILAEALDLRLGDAGGGDHLAQLVDRRRLAELEGQLGAAGEVDSQVQLAVDEDGEDADQQQDRRHGDEEPAVPHEVDVGLLQEFHGAARVGPRSAG